MLSPGQVEFFNEQGYLRIPQLFSPEQMVGLDSDLERLVAEWAMTSPGGPAHGDGSIWMNRRRRHRS